MTLDDAIKRAKQVKIPAGDTGLKLTHTESVTIRRALELYSEQELPDWERRQAEELRNRIKELF